MPWRLIKFIAVFAIFLLFIMLNLDHRSDISVGFRTFSDVPVFLTAFFSFILVMLLTLPFVVGLWLRLRKGNPKGSPKGNPPGKKPAGKKESPDRPAGAGREERPAELKDYGID